MLLISCELLLADWQNISRLYVHFPRWFVSALLSANVVSHKKTAVHDPLAFVFAVCVQLAWIAFMSLLY